MDKAQEEEAKAVIEKLKSENKRKKELYENLKKSKIKLKSENKKKEELCESLRKSQNKQIVKIQEAVLRIEKQAQELIEKGGEVPANEKRRFGSDKSKAKNANQEQKIHAFQEEIKSLKELLVVSEEKCSKADVKMTASKELSDGDRTLLMLEEKNRKIEEQIKLKKEEFKRLEQKDAKLGDQLNINEKQRRKKKSSLLDVIATLQSKPDRREENAFADCQDANPSVTEGVKEMEFPANELDQETQELLKSASTASVTKLKLKLKAVEHKYRHCSKTLKAKESEWSAQLEKLTTDLNECKSELESKNIAIEDLMTELETSCSLMMEMEQSLRQSAEGSAQLEKLKEELFNCKSESEDKDTAIEEMMLELEGSHSVMTELHLLNEELKSQLQIMKRKLKDSRSESEDKDTAIEEMMLELEGSHSVMTELHLLNEELKSQLQIMKSESEDKDTAIEEMMLELEGSHSVMTELHLLNEELKSQLQIMKSESEDKDTAIEEMMLELEGSHSVMTELHLLNEELKSQLQIMKRKFKDSRSELDERDKTIEELMGELESFHSLMLQLKLQIEESEMTQQLEKIRKEFNECRSESESKDITIEELMRELDDSRSLVIRLKLQNEADWSSHWMNMARDFNDCRIEINDKDKTKEELLKDLEDCHSQITGLMLQNDGTSLTLMILKSEIYEAQLKLTSKEKERDKKMEWYREMFTESYRALEGSTSELEEKICEINELEFELQIYKSFADRLRVNLEENYETRKELENSLLEEVEFEETFNREKNGVLLMLDEKLRKVSSLQEHEIRERGIGSSEKSETELTSESLKTSGSNTTQENMILDNLRKQLGLLEQESLRRELEGAVLAKIAAERNFNHEKQNLIQQMGEKNHRIYDLMRLVTSLEEKFNSSLESFSLTLSEKQAEIRLVGETWEKMTSAEIMGVLEVEEKKLVITSLEDEVHDIEQKLETPDKSLCKIQILY